MTMEFNRCYRIFVAIVYLCTGCMAQLHLNVSLDEQSLSVNNNFSVIFSGIVKVFCKPGETSYQLYNLQENEYSSCPDNPGDKVIGHCDNSPLNININKLAVQFNDVVSYEIGNTYYFGAYDTVNGQVSDNYPCMNGVKFSFKVIAQPEIEVTTSSFISATPSSSLHSDGISSTLSVSSAVVSDTALSITTPPASMISSSSPDFLRSSSTVNPVRPTSSTRPTVATARPTDPGDPIVDGIADSAPRPQLLWILLVSLLCVSTVSLIVLL